MTFHLRRFALLALVAPGLSQGANVGTYGHVYSQIYLNGVTQGVDEMPQESCPYSIEEAPSKTGYWWKKTDVVRVTSESQTTIGTYTSVSYSVPKETSANIYENVYFVGNPITVTYEGNGSTGGTKPADSSFTYDVSGTVAANSFTREFTVSYNANGGSVNPSSAKAASTFANWANTKSGSASYTYSSGQTGVTNPGGSTGGTVTLFARWNDTSVKLPTPGWTGHSFDGWYTEQTGGTRVGGGGDSYGPVSASKTLYAHWTESSYTATIAPGEGGSGGGSVPYTYSNSQQTKTITLPTYDDGHYISKWTASGYSGSAPTVSGNVLTIPGGTSGNFTMTPMWSAIKCTLTLSSAGNGSVSSFPSGSSHDYGTSIKITATPNDGFAFSHWESTVAPTTVDENPYTFDITTDAQFQAYFTNRVCKVTFDPMEGVCSESSRSVTYGLQIGALPTPTNGTHSFEGWYDDQVGGNQITQTKVVTSDLTAYARWGEAQKYTITVCAEPTAGGMVSGGGQYASGASATLTETPNTGYSFKKWNDGVTTPSREVTVSGDATYTAEFGANIYTIMFNATPGACSEFSRDVTYDSTYGASAPLPTPTRDGYNFSGWYLGENLITDSTVVKITKLEVLVAKWNEIPFVDHYVRFDRNGATNETEMALQTFSGAETNALSVNIYGKVGYTFAGWATNFVDAASCRVTYTNCQAVSFPMAQPNETNDLYAVWATNRYTIVFDPGNAPTDTNHYFFGTMAPLTNCLYDTAITIRCGWTNYCSQGLKGWSKTQGAEEADYPVRTTSPLTQGNDAIVSNLTAVADDSVKLYAVWADVGDLSKAAGLTNAVLYSSNSSFYEWKSSTASSWDWDTNHNERVACKRKTGTTGSGGVGLLMKVHGPGVLRFSWCSRIKDENNAQFYVNNLETLNLYEAGKQKRNWDHPVELKINCENEHVIIWNFSGNLQTELEENPDVLAVDDITWMPDSPSLEPTPVNPINPPKYETEEEAEVVAANAKVVPPNAEVAAVVTTNNYDAMFAKPLRVVQTSGGRWTLECPFTEGVSNEVQAVLNKAAANLADAAGRHVYGEGPFSVSLMMTNGLYYGLAASDAIGAISTLWPTNWVLGTGDVQELKVDRPSEDTGFFRLRVEVTTKKP